MLVISRRVNEGIELSGGIRFVVLGFKNGKVRIGIEAPDEVGIARAEIAEDVLLAPRHRRQEVLRALTP